jgi:hypothetical protein
MVDLDGPMVSPYVSTMSDPNLATVRARRAELAKLRRAIDDEDSELEIAERALTRLAASRPESINFSRPMSPPATQRELIEAVLKVSPDPWIESPAALRAEIERTHGVKIKPTSFQPLLSTLKKEGVIARDRLKIALADRIRQERAEAPC